MNIGQISYETDQLLIIQIWGLQTKSRCYMDTVQIKLKPGDLIKREVWCCILPEKFTVGLI